MKNIKLFKVTEVVDLEGRKNVPCNWFVIWRERPLFGCNGSLGLDYADVIAPGHDDDGEAAAEELFTEEEAKAFARFARRLQINASIEPATLPLPKDTQSFQMRIEMRGYQLAVLKVKDEAGRELPFAVSCWDDPPLHPVEAALRQLVAMGLVVETGERRHGQPVYFAVPEDKLAPEQKRGLAEFRQEAGGVALTTIRKTGGRL
jgi:hypothetical protein